MTTPRAHSSLLLQALLIVAGCELAIMLGLPLLLPKISRETENAIDTLLLLVTAGPLLWWRIMRHVRRAGTGITFESGEAAESIRRVRVVSIAGFVCAGLLAVGGALMWERLVEFNGALTAYTTSDVAGMKWLGRVVGIVLVGAVVLIWQLAIDPVVRHVAEAEEKLRREQALVQAILKYNPEGILAADVGGIIRLANPAVEKMLGYGEGELVGMPITSLIPHPLREAHRHNFHRLVAWGDPHLLGKPIEMRALRRDGDRVEEIPVELTLGMAQYSGDKLFTASMRNISEQVAARRALQQARDHAEAVNADLLALNETHAALFVSRSVSEVARILSDLMVNKFDAYFARVWLRRPADLCNECANAGECCLKQSCLHLVASSGYYTHLDGPHRRVPLGAFKIGLIAQGRGKTISHDVVNDERVHNHAWAAEHQLRSFVGLPLERDGRVIGVMAMFSRKDMPDHVLETLEILALLGAAAIGNVELIDGQRAAAEAAEIEARTDKLTGLPNRAMLLEHLQLALDRARRVPDYHYAVLFMDIDRFKMVNDSFGHEFGDMLLRDIGERLRDSLRANDTVSRFAADATVARFGGDEFVILLDGIKQAQDAALVANRLLATFEAPFQLGAHEFCATTSIGIVQGNPEYDTAEEILRDADVALYKAKSDGKARYVMFDASMQEVVQVKLEIENDLRTALGSDQLFLEYQPIVSLKSGKLEGVEALIRWNHPRRGLLLPDTFIPIAEEAGLIIPLSDWILEQACAQLAEWRNESPDRAPTYVSVNISRVQLLAQDFVENIRETLRRTGLSPDQILLELTESSIMKHPELTKVVFRDLKAAGIRVAMDDFGTGHSSLSCLHEYPIDILKIDRSFILNSEPARSFIPLTRTIVSLANDLGMECIAEGIEDRAHCIELRALGCTYGQGYYFGRPVPPDDLIRGDWKGAAQSKPPALQEIPV